MQVVEAGGQGHHGAQANYYGAKRVPYEGLPLLSMLHLPSLLLLRQIQQDGDSANNAAWTDSSH